MLITDWMKFDPTVAVQPSAFTQQSVMAILQTFCNIHFVHDCSFDTSQESLIADLRSPMYSLVNAGSYAAVYSKSNNSPNVYKVGYLYNNISYLIFLREAINSGSSTFPHVNSVDIFTNGKFVDTTFVVNMERLSSIRSTYVEELADDLITKICKNKAAWEDGSRLEQPFDVWFGVIDRSIDISLNQCGTDACVDLHMNNIMCRKQDGRHELVCTDPVCPTVSHL